MPAIAKATPILVTVILVAGGLACRKPAPVAPPEKPKADTSTQDKARDEAESRQRLLAEQKRKAEAEAEAARKAAAQKEADYQKAATAALKDVHFDFDKSDIRESDKVVLQAIADFLKTYPQAKLTIDGNCDERGTVEYNLALGERRGHAALAYLVGLGAPSDRLSSTTYGKEKPVCTESTESCWGRNRRAHFALK